jgi:hypothetical protein
MTTELDTLRPPYYKGDGKIEVWDFVISQNLGFLDGNIVKYVCRYKGKNGLEDLKKARQYLDKLIAVTEREQEKSNEKEKDTNDIELYLKAKIHQATEMIDIINQGSAREKWEKEQREWWAGHKQAYEDCLRILDKHKE